MFLIHGVEATIQPSPATIYTILCRDRSLSIEVIFSMFYVGLIRIMGIIGCVSKIRQAYWCKNLCRMMTACTCNCFSAFNRLTMAVSQNATTTGPILDDYAYRMLTS